MTDDPAYRLGLAAGRFNAAMRRAADQIVAGLAAARDAQQLLRHQTPEGQEARAVLAYRRRLAAERTAARQWLDAYVARTRREMGLPR